MKIYLQTKNYTLFKYVHGTVYNMALHGKKWLKWIKDNNKPFLLVHGGFQNKMKSYEEIISFSEKHNPELIIAPDVYKNQKTTTRMTLEFTELCNDKILNKTAGVIQGGIEDFINTIHIYKKIGLNWVAIPSDNKPILSLSKYLMDNGWKIHILGGRNFTIHANSVDIVSDTFDELKNWISIRFWKK